MSATTSGYILLAVWSVPMIYQYGLLFQILQLKEYRMDRLKDFLWSVKGKTWLVSYHVLIRIMAGLFALFLAERTNQPIHSFFAVLVVLDWLMLFTRVRTNGVQRPVLTKKIILLFGIVLPVEFAALYIAHNITPWCYLVVIARPVIAFLCAIGLQYPTKMLKRLIVLLATKKMQRLTHVKVIGITGSYGKSSVKYYTQHLLGALYTVIATPKNINTEIGIAQFILKHDFSNVQYFVVEMGAYTMGEIRVISSMVEPDVGVLTAVNEQHIALFGSLENTTTAKYELLRAVPEHGFVVTNADNKYCMKYVSELKSEVLTFGLDEEANPTCLITDLSAKQSSLSFEVKCSNKQDVIRVSAPVIGRHQAMNILPAMMIALKEGVPIDQVHQRLLTVNQHAHGQIRVYDYGKATVIDDHYNANPDGVKAALDVLSTYPSSKKRIVITRGMLELGSESEELHVRMGEEIAFAADELVAISADSFPALKRGVGNKYQTHIVDMADVKDLLAFVKKQKDQDVVILILNKLPSIVMKEISPIHGV